MTTTTIDLSTTDKVLEFLQRDDVLGEIGYERFYDHADDYGEPGYSLSDGLTPMVILGSFWCRCMEFGADYADGTALHGIDKHFPEEWATLEEQGVQFEWYDEWVTVHEYVDGQYVTNAYRTASDSYHWKPSAILDDDSCEWLTPNTPDEEWVEWALNDPRRCIPSNMLDAADPTLVGWDDEADEPQVWWEYNEDSEHAGYATTYQSGWFDGQNAKPEEITEQIRSQYGETTDVIFVLDETSQFYISFSAYYRRNDEG